LTELSKAMISLHLALSLAEFCRRREGLANRLSLYLTSQPKIRAMAWLIGQMTTAVWFSAPATDGGDRAAAKISQFHDLRQNSAALLFQVGE